MLRALAGRSLAAGHPEVERGRRGYAPISIFYPLRGSLHSEKIGNARAIWQSHKRLSGDWRFCTSGSVSEFALKKRWYADEKVAEQIVTLVRQIGVDIANGKTTWQVCKEAQWNISEMLWDAKPDRTIRASSNYSFDFLFTTEICRVQGDVL